MKFRATQVLGAATILVSAAAAYASDGNSSDSELRELYNSSVRYSNAVEFPSIVPGGNIAHGRDLFGINASGQIDTSQALFEGNSVIYGPVHSNGTACATCHQPQRRLMFPALPILAHVAATDPLVTGRNAEAQGDPRQADLFNLHGLVKQRPQRFNPILEPTDPVSRVFTWRKTQTVMNMAFNFGLLTDGRARGAIEQIRGAVFNHTQDTDIRFDDLANPSLTDIAAWMQTQIDPPELSALLNPADPNHQNLVDDPFATVHTTTQQQRDGQRLFERNCMSCHNMPNVFGNRDHVTGNGPNFPPLTGHTFDVGVSERNKHHLDFRFYDTTNGQMTPIVLPLVREDGKTIAWTVKTDLGAAAATGRYEDLHRFKVPQLRHISELGPYFHDNSADTLDDVVDYFDSDDYNKSTDGKQYPIHLSRDEKKALVAFLKVL